MNVKVLFKNGHNASSASDNMTINGIPVVSNQNGTLLPIPIHEMGSPAEYKVLDPNTTLEVYYTADYDGSQNPAFVVVGNPLVLSSSTYSIYANGWNDFVNNCELSEWENFYAYNNNSWTMTSAPYDGFVTIYTNGGQGVGALVQINDVDMGYNSNASYGTNSVGSYAFRKGDKVVAEPRNVGGTAYICFYKKRDYSNR